MSYKMKAILDEFTKDYSDPRDPFARCEYEQDQLTRLFRIGIITDNQDPVKGGLRSKRPKERSGKAWAGFGFMYNWKRSPPITDNPYTLITNSGQEIKGTTNSDGYIDIDDLNFKRFKIKVEN